MKKRKYLYYLFPFLVVLLILMPIIVPNTFYRMLFCQTLINIIVVIGLNFITGLTGQMNLGTAGIFALGAYTSGLLTTRLQLSPWIALIAVIAMGVVIGIVLGWPSLRIRGIYLALTTLGFGEIIRLLLTNAADVTGGTQGVLNIPPYTFFGIKFDNELSNYYLLLVFVIVLAIISVRIIKSKWGRALKAINDNEQAVESCGINIAEIKIKAFLLCTVYGCIAGALYAHLMAYINPADFTFDLTIKYLIMLMLGGIGSIPGNIIGAVIVTILPEILRFMQDYYWLVFCAIILVIVIVLPNGIVSLFNGVSGPKKLSFKRRKI